MNRLKIVVSDASVLMDLAKVRLIEAAAALPFDFMIPESIRLNELLDLGAYTSDDLIRLGFRPGTLEAADTGVALAYFRTHRRKLSINDCFAWRLAEVHAGILMTGDGDLRALAATSGVEVHGTLWVAELIGQHETCARQALVDALDILDADDRTHLPRAPLRALRGKLSRRS